MSRQSTDVQIEVAAVTDRGLSEKRPLNEDSFLADTERRIFAVADGVGGAEAGEVASQTAIEVLDEAFRHHQPGDDIEDLMEIAIQRANSSIHQMSREHPKFSMMATTIVALHLDGRRATIGHVGDSRLYRFAPDGKLFRETDDHSVVEEEVRAGRMTPEQAATHPSRNVISRALGAESSVEVDMKSFEVDNGTLFLLCSDGITRHVPDAELRSIVTTAPNAEAACAEMKRRCFERGAEDNLTAVLIRIGERPAALSADDADRWDEEKTLIAERPVFATAAAAALTSSSASSSSSGRAVAPTNTAPTLQRPLTGGEAASPTATPHGEVQLSTETPPPGENFAGRGAAIGDDPSAPAQTKSGGRKLRIFAVTLLILAASALAFLGGMFFNSRRFGLNRLDEAVQPPGAAPAPTPERDAAQFADKRREVDRSPAIVAEQMNIETGNQPLNSSDPEFLYLYGRARLLSGNYQEAAEAFQRAITHADENLTSERAQLKIDARLAHAAALIKANDVEGARRAAEALGDVSQTAPATIETPAEPSQSPVALPRPSVPSR